MPSRAELNLRAYAIGLDPSTIPNDSKLEQKIIFAEKSQTAAAISATSPTTTLTSTGTAAEGETFTIGGMTYMLKTALDAASTLNVATAASVVLTSSGTVSNNETVVIGSKTYTFKTTLTPADGEVLVGATAAASLSNLAQAVNLQGSIGSAYASNMTLNANVRSTTLTATTLKFEAKTLGYAGNAIASTETCANWAFATATLTGGHDSPAYQVLIGGSASVTLDNIKEAINCTGTPGTNYSQNTPRNPVVTAGAKTATTLVCTVTDSNIGGSTATTETMANFSWTGANLSAGTLGASVVSDTNTGTRNTLAGVSGGSNTSL